MFNSKASTLARGAGMAADIWTRLDRAVKTQGGTNEDLHLLARKEGQPIIDQIASLLVCAGVATRNVFYPIVIDYGQTLDQMIKAGRYDCCNSSITSKSFPVVKESTVKTEVTPVHFNHDISSENAIKKMELMGLTPAKTEHLLAYGAQHWQRDPELVVALGSSWVIIPNGNHNAPCLTGCHGREINLLRFDSDWLDSWHFLAVRKS